MTGIQIFLILLGVVTVAGSFVFSDLLEKGSGADSGSLAGLSDENVKKKIDEAVESAVGIVVDEAIEQRLDKTEAQLEKISNEKIMALNDYSETILAEIHKNHEEVMFLYGMLNDKEEEIKNTVQDIEAVKKSVKIIKDEWEAEAVAQESVRAEKSESVSWTDVLPEQMEFEPDTSTWENRGSNSSDSSQSSLQMWEQDMNSVGDTEWNFDQPEAAELDEDVTEFKISVKQEKKGVALKAGDSGKNNNQKILDLYSQGKNNVEIAKELDLGIGEVRLVIDLYKNKRR
ncbi:MAG: hypothetical protein HFI34_02480 [Lachnospiraceae bacterium]|nr:hypothetical protein [Lachnospiraceae bacterium]